MIPIFIGAAVVAGIAVVMVSIYPDNSSSHQPGDLDRLRESMLKNQRDIEAINERLNRLADDITSSKRDYDAELKQDVEYVKMDIKELKSVSISLPQKFGDIAHRIDLLDETRKRVKDMKLRLDDNDRALDVAKAELLETVEVKIKEVERDLQETTNRLSEKSHKIVNELKSNMKRTSSELESTRAMVDETVNRFGSLKTDMEAHINDILDIKEHQLDILAAVQGISSLSKEQQDFLTEKIAPNTFNKRSLSLAIAIVVVIQMLECLALYVLWRR